MKYTQPLRRQVQRSHQRPSRRQKREELHNTEQKCVNHGGVISNRSRRTDSKVREATRRNKTHPGAETDLESPSKQHVLRGSSLDWAYLQHGKTILKCKANVQTQDVIVKFRPELHDDEFDKHIQWQSCQSKHTGTASSRKE
jgi:hypothetical protein